MQDIYSLAKFYRTGPVAETNAHSYGWQANDKPLPKTADLAGGGKAYLLGYLMHYCRLSEKLDRTGTKAVLQALLEAEPDNGETHYLLARQFEREGALSAALESFERAASLCLDKPTYMLAATRVACLLGDRNKGLALVCSVISAYPNLAEAYHERGLIHEADENWRRALRDYEMCNRLEPQAPAYLCSIASMYRHLKLYKVARRCAVKALKLDPNYGPAHEELRQIPFFEQLLDFGNHQSEESEASLARQSNLLYR